MSVSLVDDVAGFLRSESLLDTAAMLNELPDATAAGYLEAFTTLLAALVDRSNDPQFTTYILPVIENRFRTGLYDSQGAPETLFLAALLGHDQALVIVKISQASGLRLGSSMRLLTLAARSILARLGHHVDEDQMTVTDFARLLNHQHGTFAATWPPPQTNEMSWPWLIAGCLTLVALLWAWSLTLHGTAGATSVPLKSDIYP